ncbi:MAG: GntR family transcriptional regulator [Acidimicrobiia bacterium]|nr:MAG: GntR family transcriptional regulator [Acidimicrobiia bacterium]
MRSADKAPDDTTQVSLVYHGIKQSILNGTYPPGTPLRLKMLSEDQGGSHIPIREALRRLEAERLVENVPNKGARVMQLSLGDLDDLYLTRSSLEADAVQRAAEHINPKAVRQLTVLAEEMNEAFAEGDEDAFLTAHRRVHFGIYDLAHSEWLDHLIPILWTQSIRYRAIAKARRSSTEIRVEHQAVIDALARGDATAAAESMRRHLSRTAGLVREYFAEVEGDESTPQLA